MIGKEPSSYHNQPLLMLWGLRSSLHLPVHCPGYQNQPDSSQIKQNMPCVVSPHTALEHSLEERCPGARHERGLLPCILAASIFTPTMPHLPGVAPGLCLPPSWTGSSMAAPWQVEEPAALPQDPAAVPITDLSDASAGRSPSPQHHAVQIPLMP